jgi:hypothetical protein
MIDKITTLLLGKRSRLDDAVDVDVEQTPT